MQTDAPYKNGSRYRQHCKCNAYKNNEINVPVCLIVPCFLSLLDQLQDELNLFCLCASLFL